MIISPQGVSLLVATTQRAVAYSTVIRDSGLRLQRALLLSPRGGGATADESYRTTILDLLRGASSRIREVEAVDLNDENVLQAVGSTIGELVVVAPPPGNILRAPLLNSGGYFLHIHPGRLPELRGSTTLHYAALLGEDVGITALLLDEGIDTGATVLEQRMPLPKNRSRIENNFDVEARASVLSAVLQRLKTVGYLRVSPQPDGPPALHTVHPVLRAIALGAAS